MSYCGARCFTERKNHCRDLQKWGRNLLSMIGLEQVSKQLSPKRYECSAIASLISSALGSVQVEEYFGKQEDWCPSEKCPICSGKRLKTGEEAVEKAAVALGTSTVANAMEVSEPLVYDDSELPTSTASALSKGNLIKNPVKQEEHPVIDAHLAVPNGHFAQALAHMLPTPMLPTIPPFLPFPDMANQFYVHNFLQWSAGGMINPNFFTPPPLSSGGPPSLPRSPVRDRCLSNSRLGALISGKENGDSAQSFGDQYLGLALAAALNGSQCLPQTVQPRDSPLNAFFPARPSALCGANPLTKVASPFPRKEKGDDIFEEVLCEEQPLDLSSKRALQVATQCASSSVLKLREGKRQRAAPSSSAAKASENLSHSAKKEDEESSKCSTSLNSSTLSSALATTPALITGTKRNYSQADLDAAVKDIRCGRLGTRRASVVYGIPRSTLRNKIYKLEAAEELSGEPSQFKRRRAGGQPSVGLKGRSAAAKKKASVCVAEETSLDETTSLKAEEAAKETSQSRPVSADPVSPSVKGNGNVPYHAGDSPATSDWAQRHWSPLARQSQSDHGGATNADEKKSSQSPSNSTGSQGDWKRCRPKRGQYRKYDKDALDEAVKSVRRGEMSVHRAGSFYGVPHSTLEYKVKERNLMRTKKRQKSVDDNLSDCGGSDNGQTTRSSRSITPIAAPSSPPNDSIANVRPPTAAVIS